MRKSKDTYFIEMASLVASRGTCARRKVGCVLVDELGHVIATGYNGPARGQEHCVDKPCFGANFPSGEGLNQCQAIHAEQNAMLQCANVYRIHTAYITHSPCVTCTKLLMNTSCQRIIFKEQYAHGESELLWLKNFPDRVWLRLDN